jgi:pimeloyl-ACP methyl ester carboxylesterase
MWLIVGLLVLAVVGAIYQAIATQRAERAHPPPGKMVGVGDQRMHINCMGQGSPTVILEAASGSMSASWVRVQQQVSDTTRVCAYDRPGMGWSESGPDPRDAKRITQDLHALLDNAGIEGPCVLAGHSYGGLYVQSYTARYPAEVAGVVLVESSHPQQFSRLPEGRQSYEQTKRLFAVAPLLTRLGVVRLFDLNPAPPELPRQQRAQIDAFNSSAHQVSTTAKEFRATSQTTDQARALTSLADKPLAVVSAGEQPPAWLELQDELSTFSSDSSRHVVDGATHTSVLYDPGDAQVTGTAVVEVAEAARNDQRLTP